MSLDTIRIEAIYPLAPSQQGMLFESLSFPTEERHIAQMHWQWQGALHRDAYGQAWEQVLARHSILRAGFLWKDQLDPLQFVLRHVRLPLTWFDWRAYSPAEQLQQFEAYLAADRKQGFNLTKVPLMRLALFQLDEHRYQAVWTTHHILLDGWCLPIILSEVHSFYHAECSGRKLHLPPAPPYGDFIAWLQLQDPAAAQAFWRQRLAGFRSPTPLATRAGKDTDNQENEAGFREVRRLIPQPLLSQMRTLARQNGVTLNTVMQGVWALLLHCYSGEADMVFGITVSGRPPALPGVEAMIGLFINTVPVRVKIESAITFAAWLQEIQTLALEQQPYEYCAAGQIQQWSEVPLTSRLFESVLVFENYPISRTADATDKPFALLDVDTIGAQTQYSLTVTVIPHDALHIQFVYRQTAFSAADIDRLSEHLQTLLETAVAAPHNPLKAILRTIPPMQIPEFVPTPAHQRVTTSRPFAPPLNAVEQQLAKIWQTLFNTPDVSMHDNFYDFGGHSLLAIRLIGQIQEHFGIQLPISALLLNPTIAELAKLIHEPAKRKETGAVFKSLIPIQPNGSKPPFFLAPGAGGTVFYMYYLARYMDPDRPFYGLQALGLDGQTAPHSTVEEMAMHFLEEIKQVQPQGPYYLVGHSFGAFIAYEMAQQLLKAGDEVAALVNLDTEAPHLIKRLPHVTTAQWMQEYVDTFTEVFADKITTAYEPALSVDPEAQWAGFAAWLHANNMMATTDEVTTARRLLEIFELQLKIPYQPKDVVPTRMILFRTTGWAEDDRPEKMGWDDLQAELEIHLVPGNHHTFIGEPHIRGVAEKLSACLTKAQRAA